VKCIFSFQRYITHGDIRRKSPPARALNLSDYLSLVKISHGNGTRGDKLVLITNRKLYVLSIGTKIGDLE